MKHILFSVFLISTIYFVNAQQFPSFYQSALLPIYDENNVIYENAFGGGLKFPIFSSIDLNFDGKNDLVILDRIDNRILPFIYVDSFNYKYRPQYEHYFPVIKRYLYLKDYNGDGLPDIFAFAKDKNSGLEVYKNTSEAYAIKFEKVSNQLEALYYKTNWSVLYLNSIDIPAIEDMDADGDLDILTFGVTGQNMDYYENLSMEKYGVPDSFYYEFADQCWGKFKEDDLTNNISLGFSCGAVRSNPKRHAGSTSLVLDLDADEDMDLLLGDVGYSGYFALINGKHDYAWPLDTIISFDKNFPSYDSAVKIRNMPAGFYLDVNQDGKKDLVMSPQDMELIDTFQGLNQVWLYLNQGENNKPDFKFSMNNFLQHHMIDLGGRTSPSFFDYDLDGDLDLFVCTLGDFNQTYYKHDRILLYENRGTKSIPAFYFAEDDYMHISSLNLSGINPSFADLDADGDQDLLLGKADGQLVYFENTAASGQKASFNLITTAYQNIDVGDFSTPCIYDVNGDLLPDLIIGEQYGTLKYYLNTGTASNPMFVLEQDTLGRLSFSTLLRQHSAPAVFDLDRNGLDDLIIGTRDENIFYVSDFTNHLQDSFMLKPLSIRDSTCACESNRIIGHRLTPAFADLYNNGGTDMISGSARGGLLYYSSQFDSVNISTEERILSKKSMDVRVFPNPFSNKLQLKLPNTDQEYAVCLFDISGKLIFEQRLKDRNEILHLSFMKGGFYILTILDEERNSVFREKIIKVD